MAATAVPACRKSASRVASSGAIPASTVEASATPPSLETGIHSRMPCRMPSRMATRTGFISTQRTAGGKIGSVRRRYGSYQYLYNPCLTAGMQLGGVVAWLAGLPAWQGFGLLIVTSVLSALVVRGLGDRYLTRLTDRIDGDVDEIVFGGVHTALYLTVGLAGAYVGTQVYDISPDIAVPLEAGTLSLVIVVWAVTLLRVGRKASTVVPDSRYIDRQMVPILQNVWSAVIAAVAIFLLLVLWNID